MMCPRRKKRLRTLPAESWVTKVDKEILKASKRTLLIVRDKKLFDITKDFS